MLKHWLQKYKEARKGKKLLACNSSLKKLNVLQIALKAFRQKKVIDVAAYKSLRKNGKHQVTVTSID